MNYNLKSGFNIFTVEQLETLQNNIELELQKRKDAENYPYKKEVDLIYELRKQYLSCCGDGYDDIKTLLTNISVLTKEEMQEVIKYIRNTYKTNDKLMTNVKDNFKNVKLSNVYNKTNYDKDYTIKLVDLWS